MSCVRYTDSGDDVYCVGRVLTSLLQLTRFPSHDLKPHQGDEKKSPQTINHSVGKSSRRLRVCLI